MSKIVFFGIPAHGHTNPTLEVVRELVFRGHEVWYYSYQNMREKIVEQGAKFIPCDAYNTEQKLSAEDSARLGSDIAFSTKVLVDTTLALDEKVSEDMKALKPDCIVADSMALWGKAVAWKLGVPFVLSTTTFAFNRHSAKIMKQGTGDLLRMLFAMPKVSREVRRLKKKGYPFRNILDIIGHDEHIHTIVYTSAMFQPCAETFSEHYAFVGPSVRTSDGKIEKIREKLIYISMGTVNNAMLPFYQACVSTFADTDYQVILSVGNQVPVEAFGTLPENISVFSQVDQIAVLKQADVFISHCGMNSVSESLYFSVPLVMFPQTAEQKGVANRVAALGAGFWLENADRESVLRAVGQIFDDDNYQKQAEKIAEDFRNCAGAKGAADKILAVCKKSHSEKRT